MAANLPKNVRAELEAKAWRLRQQCWTQGRIAEYLGVSQRTVSGMLDRVHRRVLANLAKEAELQKVVITEQLFHLIDEAYQAWERSKKPRNRVSKRTLPPPPQRPPKKGGAPEPPALPSETKTEEAQARDGDPAFIAAIMAAHDRICRLWGLDARNLDDQGNQGTTVSEIVLRLKANSERFEARQQQLPGPGGGADGGSVAVP